MITITKNKFAHKCQIFPKNFSDSLQKNSAQNCCCDGKNQCILKRQIGKFFKSHNFTAKIACLSYTYYTLNPLTTLRAANHESGNEIPSPPVSLVIHSTLRCAISVAYKIASSLFFPCNLPFSIFLVSVRLSRA